MIPLYREDVGKEVLVELRPVYGDYENQAISLLHRLKIVDLHRTTGQGSTGNSPVPGRRIGNKRQ